MPEFDDVPTAYWWNPDIDAATLGSDLHDNNGRLVSLDAFVRDGHLRFCAAWVAKDGDAAVSGGWDHDIEPQTLRAKMTDVSGRITCLTSYVLHGKRHYAAGWVHNAGSHHKTYWWHHDLDPETLGSRLDKDNGRLAVIDAWDKDGTTHCAAVWTEAIGADAAANWWHPRVDADQLAGFLADNTGRVVCLDAYLADGDVRYAAGWIENTGALSRTWFWWDGIDAATVGQQLDLYCGYPIEIQSFVDGHGARVLTAVIDAPPPPLDPGAALLAPKLSGKLTTVAGDYPSSQTDTDYDPAPLHQWMDLDLALDNGTSAPIAVKLAELYAAESGGFIYADGPENALTGFFAGASPTVASGAALHSTGTRDWGFGIEQYLLRWRATQSGVTQDSFAAAKISRHGYTAPPTLHAPEPVMLTLWTDPAEFVPMWVNGERTTWLSVGGQILNASEKSMRIAGFSITLVVDGKTLLDEPFVPQFSQWKPNRTDPHRDFVTLPPFTGVPKFADFATLFATGFDVSQLPKSFTKATLQLVLNYKIGTRCGAAVYETPVVRRTPITVRPPLKGTWNFGSSPDHRGFDAHSWPAQRFSVDFTKLGPDGNSFATNVDPNPNDDVDSDPLHDNKNFFAYGQPISAMASGKVVAAIDVYPPNFGQKTNPASLLNYILIEHDPHGGPNHFFHGYYHVHQFANQVSEGDQVSAGQALGKIGNAGGSSEPHLHIGLVEYDATGNGTLVPVAYSGLRQGDKQLPDDIVPATAQYTS